eukprot:scaffold27151_cov58-Cyclotella_meneghiniana.AAC.13
MLFPYLSNLFFLPSIIIHRTHNSCFSSGATALLFRTSGLRGTKLSDVEDVEEMGVEQESYESSVVADCSDIIHVEIRLQ